MHCIPYQKVQAMHCIQYQKLQAMHCILYQKLQAMHCIQYQKVQAMHCIPYQKVHAMHCILYQKNIQLRQKRLLYSVMHNSAKRYWGVGVKFPFNEVQSRCGHTGIKKKPGHSAMFKIFVESTFYVSCQQTAVCNEGEGGMRNFYNSHVPCVSEASLARRNFS